MRTIDERLRLPLHPPKLITEFFSSEGQDLFVISCLNGKMNGTFFDIGCAEARHNNNTFLLEKWFGWKGICVDILVKNAKSYDDEKRTAKLLIQEALQLDYSELANELGSSHIDFLSLDLDPAETTYQCLLKILSHNVEFSVITFEHDEYRFGSECKKKSREIFFTNGYDLLCSDVGSNDGLSFEDWYVNPKYVDMDRANVLRSVGVRGRQIVLNG